MKASLPSFTCSLCLLTLTSFTPSGWGAVGVAPALVTPPSVAGATPNGDTTVAALSADGRSAVLASPATDLTANPNSGGWLQLYLRDSVSGRIELVSATPSGAAGNGNSGRPAVSADGRWVVFESEASDLVEGDTNSVKDIFLRDVVAGVTTLVSRTPEVPIARGGFSEHPVMSPDARWIAFTSYATNLAGSVTDTNRTADVFLFDTASQRLQVASQQHLANATGTSASVNPALSPDGRWLAFSGSDGKLAAGAPADTALKLFLRGTAAETNFWASGGAAAFDALVPPGQNREPRNATFSADGRFLAYTYGPLVLRLATESGETVLVGTNFVPAVVAQTGGPRLALSGDGQVCAWEGGPREGDVLPDVPDAIHVWDAVSQNVARLQPALADPALPGEVGSPVLSVNGQKIAFVAHIKTPGEEGLPPGRQWCLHDRGTGQTTRLNLADAEPGGPLPEIWSPLWTPDLGVVAFACAAPDLAPGDLNRAQDAFLHELATGQTKLLSARAATVSSPTAGGGSVARGQCFSADGRFLVFTTSAADVVPNDRNGVEDVFLRDLHAGTTTLVSVNRAGNGPGNGASHSPAISADGRFVAFASLAGDLVEGDTNGLNDVFVRDLQTGSTLLVSRAFGGTGSASGGSYAPSLSADGRLIAFESRATNLVAPELTDFNGVQADVFVFDRESGTNQLVSLRADGTGTGIGNSYEPVITADGRRVLFKSGAIHLKPLPPPPWPAYPDTMAYVRDLAGQTTTLLQSPEGQPYAVSVADARPIVVSADSSTLAVATRLPVRGVAVLRLSGEFVAQVTNVASPALSADGRLLVYVSQYLPGPNSRHVYLLRLADGTTHLVSVSRDGVTPGNSWSYQAVLSADGRYVVFKSLASNLVPGDANGYGDIFVRDLTAGRTMLLSALPSGGSPNHGSLSPVLAPDGRTVAFLSWATDLAPGDLNRGSDVFVVRLGSGPAADSDEDGLPDDWEVTYFNSLVRDGSGDWDNDGANDRAEYLAGTDPTDEGSAFRVLTLTGVGGDGVTVVWSATAGRTYRVQFKDTVDAPWTDLPGDVTASGDTASKPDTTAGASLARFYRALLVE